MTALAEEELAASSAYPKPPVFSSHNVRSCSRYSLSSCLDACTVNHALVSRTRKTHWLNHTSWSLSYSTVSKLRISDIM